MNNKKYLLLLFLPLLVGCAAQQERAAQKSIQQACNKLIGATEEDVALELGVPQHIQNIGKLRVYQYFQSYGTHSSKGNTEWSLSNLSGYCEERRWEAYDKIEVFFRDGHVVQWKSFVKR
jgi:hypothetical protein